MVSLPLVLTLRWFCTKGLTDYWSEDYSRGRFEDNEECKEFRIHSITF